MNHKKELSSTHWAPRMGFDNDTKLKHLQVLELFITATGCPRRIRCWIKSYSRSGTDKFYLWSGVSSNSLFLVVSLALIIETPLLISLGLFSHYQMRTGRSGLKNMWNK